MPKHAIRRELLARRKQLENTDRLHWSLQAQQRLIDSACFKGAQVLSLYSPIRNEVETDFLFSAARAAGKLVCYPRVKAERLEFIVVAAASELQAGRFGVAEPQSGKRLAVTEVDLIVVPRGCFRSGWPPARLWQGVL